MEDNCGQNVQVQSVPRNRFDKVREALGVLILVAIVGLHSYDYFFPIPTEERERISRETSESLELTLERARLLHETPEVKHHNEAPAAPNSSTHEPNSYLSTALRLLSLLIAVVLLYLALFLYEDENGRLQNRLEEWWIKTHDAHIATVSFHLRFLRGFASFAERGMSVVFGERVISVRALGVSLCFALASANLYQYLNDSGSPLQNQLLNAFYWLALGIVPSLFDDRVLRLIWMFFLLLLIWNDFLVGWINMATFAYSIDQPVLIVASLGILAAVSVSCIFAFLSIAAIRFLIKKVSESGVFLSTAIWLILISVPGAFFYKPWYALNLLPLSSGESVVILGLAVLYSLIVINSFLFIPSAFFFALSFLLVLHKIIGEFIHRFIYAFQSLEIPKRNKLIFAVAVAMLGFGLGFESKLMPLLEKAIL